MIRSLWLVVILQTGWLSRFAPRDKVAYDSLRKQTLMYGGRSFL